jgi:hypothetical protein
MRLSHQGDPAVLEPWRDAHLPQRPVSRQRFGHARLDDVA